MSEIIFPVFRVISKKLNIIKHEKHEITKGSLKIVETKQRPSLMGKTRGE